MRNRYNSYRNGNVREVRIDYVESKLDETVMSFKELIKEVKLGNDETIRGINESIKESEARLAADRQATETKLENERIAAERRLAADREEFRLRFAEERKEWRSTKRWLYLNFGGVMALLITVALAFMNSNLP